LIIKFQLFQSHETPFLLNLNNSAGYFQQFIPGGIILMVPFFSGLAKYKVWFS